MTTTSTATATPTRYFGRCSIKGCKHRQVTEGTALGYLGPLGPQATFTPCPNHCVAMDWKPMKVKVTEKVCNGVCMGAIGPSCDCSCGGENHGRNHL